MAAGPGHRSKTKGRQPAGRRQEDASRRARAPTARTPPGPHRGDLRGEPAPTEPRPDGRCGPGGGPPSGRHTVFLLSQCVDTPTHPPDQQRLLRVFSSASFVREANRAIVLQVLDWSRVTSAQQTW